MLLRGIFIEISRIFELFGLTPSGDSTKLPTVVESMCVGFPLRLSVNRGAGI